MKVSEAVRNVYDTLCEQIQKWSMCDYVARYHLQRVSYHLSAIKHSHVIVAPTAHAIYDAKALAGQTYSGVFVLYSNNTILNKDFWMMTCDVLSGKRGYPHDNRIVDDLSSMRLEAFEPVCLSSLGLRSEEHLVLGQYNKLRNIVTKYIEIVDRAYYVLQKYGLSKLDDPQLFIDTAQDTNVSKNSEEQDTASSPHQAKQEMGGNS